MEPTFRANIWNRRDHENNRKHTFSFCGTIPELNAELSVISDTVRLPYDIEFEIRPGKKYYRYFPETKTVYVVELVSL